MFCSGVSFIYLKKRPFDISVSWKFLLSQQAFNISLNVKGKYLFPSNKKTTARVAMELNMDASIRINSYSPFEHFGNTDLQEDFYFP